MHSISFKENKHKSEQKKIIISSMKRFTHKVYIFA